MIRQYITVKREKIETKKETMLSQPESNGTVHPAVDFIKYEEMDQQLLRTDLQKLRNEEAGVGQGSGEGKRMAMKLDFTLSASCYASMAVREICKGSVEGMTT